VIWLQLYLDFMVFAFGAVIGSFLNVCVHRMPLDQSIVTPPSHCPHCSQRIRWADNIPLLSYLALRGKCRHCGATISPRYFVVELLTAALFLMVWLRVTPWDNTPVRAMGFLVGPIYWLVIAGLIVATFIDFEHYIIPNELTLGGVIVGFVLSVAVPPLQRTDSHGLAALRSLGGILTGGMALLAIAEFGKLVFGRLRVRLPQDTAIAITDCTLKLPDEKLVWSDIFFRRSDKVRFIATRLKVADKEFAGATVIVREDSITINGEKYPLATVGVIEATVNEIILPREAMGLGDVKLLAGIGAFLGWQATVFAIFLSAAVGSIVSLGLIALGKKAFSSKIPYGPYIALGAVVWIFAQARLLAMIATYLDNLREIVRILFSRG
jgi:leader peptidase (prepilin peptidase)/N-methyltransferase